MGHPFEISEAELLYVRRRLPKITSHKLTDTNILPRDFFLAGVRDVLFLALPSRGVPGSRRARMVIFFVGSVRLLLVVVIVVVVVVVVAVVHFATAPMLW